MRSIADLEAFLLALFQVYPPPQGWEPVKTDGRYGQMVPGIQDLYEVCFRHKRNGLHRTFEIDLEAVRGMGAGDFVQYMRLTFDWGPNKKGPEAVASEPLPPEWGEVCL